MPYLTNNYLNSLKARMLAKEPIDVTQERAKEIYQKAWNSHGWLAYWELPEWPEIRKFWNRLTPLSCFMECISRMANGEHLTTDS